MKELTRSVAILLLFALLLATIPVASAGIDQHTIPAPRVNETIVITITSPIEGAEGWIDVVPPHVAVVGEVHAPAGLHNVVVRSGTEEVSCGNGTEFACSVPVLAGKNAITVVATDNYGRRAEKTVNLTVCIGIPPSPLITVSGRVTDTGGNLIRGASVRFESVLTLDDEPLAATATTGEDGAYLVDTPGYRQTVTVEKEGYVPLRQGITFENPTNTLDLELEPLPRTVPGFGPAAGLLGTLGAVWIFWRAKK